MRAVVEDVRVLVWGDITQINLDCFAAPVESRGDSRADKVDGVGAHRVGACAAPIEDVEDVEACWGREGA